MTNTAEFQDVTREQFERDIVPLGRPAVLRGLVRDWPAVVAAQTSQADIVAYLKALGGSRAVDVVLAPPEVGGRFHYSDDVRGFNFVRDRAPFDQFVDQLVEQSSSPRPIAMAMQSAPTAMCLPGFAEENRLHLLAADVAPRIWIGGPLKVATHYDAQRNIACAVAGRRRFTLFPPEQIANLYPGPLELTPAGTPVSMVHVTAPDLVRFPRFADALAAADTVDLTPGDALYMPYQWWHHVESLDPVSVLVNYWWIDAPLAGKPMDALLYGLLALRTLPHDQRRAWRALFDHWVFEANGDPVAHLPVHAQGVLGKSTPKLIEVMRARLRQILARD